MNVARVEKGAVYDEVRLTGTVLPLRRSDISSELEGKVEERLFEDGDFVTTGQPLLRLRSKPTELQLQEAEMRLAIWSAELEELLNGTRPEDIAVDRAEVAEAEARVALAKVEADRLEELRETNVASASDYDRARAELERAVAELARKQAELERSVTGPRQEEIERARAEVGAAEARVEQLRDELDRHTVRAPFAGIVGLTTVEIGQWVQAGDTLLSIGEITTLYIEVNLPEKYFNRVRTGEVATVRFDAIPDRVFEVPVTIRIPVADIASRTMPYRLTIQNEELNIAPGMLARVTFRLSESGGAPQLLVPKDAVVMSPDRRLTVWIVRDTDEGTKAFPVDVTTGKSFKDLVEITTGELQEGDRVVVRGNEVLRFPGQPVEVRGASQPNQSPEVASAAQSG